MTYDILPDFKLYTYINQNFKYFGIDSPDFCVDQEFFKNYPHTIDYQYNSRGFRDDEWPDNLHDLQNAIWCVGDSFSIGLGSPVEHTWPYILQQTSGTRTINVSMNGASNMWMSRRTTDILKEIQPKRIVIQWSFLHRRERTVEEAQKIQWQDFYNRHKESSWPPMPDIENINTLPEHVLNITQGIHNNYWQVITDQMRLLHFDRPTTTEQDDIDNVIQCIRQVEANKGNTQIIHSFIPAACPLDSMQDFLIALDSLDLQSIGLVEQLDFARDKFHYDINTSKKIVNNLLTLI